MSIADFPWRGWSHVVKLDPDKEIGSEQLADIISSGTDAILIGGSQGITYEKTDRLVTRLGSLQPAMPVWQEISAEHAVLPGNDGYAIPVVLNAGTTEWLIGKHIGAVKQFGGLIPWDQVVVEGYIVLNPESAVAELTKAVIPVTLDDAKAIAIAAERIFGLHVLYLEYSGVFGNPEWVEEIRRVTTGHLIYGGGISTAEHAAVMAAFADTVVVGNAVYERGVNAVRESVAAVKEVHASRQVHKQKRGLL